MNLYHMDGMVVFVLLVVCTCAYMRRVPRLKAMLFSEKKGFFGALYKGAWGPSHPTAPFFGSHTQLASPSSSASVIGIRLHLLVALACLGSTVYLVFVK